MSFPTITKRKLLAELRDRHDDGRGSPTDPEIMELLDLWDAQQIRSLLAELAEAGEITVRWDGPTREILIGRQAKAATIKAVAQPSVKRADAAKPPPSRIDLIAEAARRVAHLNAANKRAQEYPGASSTARKASGASVSADAERIEDRAPSAKGREVMEAPPAPPHKGEWEKIGKTIDAARAPRPAKAKAPTTHPVLINLDKALYGTLADEANRRGIKPGTHVREIVEQAVNGSTSHIDPAAKLRLPADISRAFGHQSLPLYDFLIEAMRLGITVMAETRREEARAA